MALVSPEIGPSFLVIGSGSISHYDGKIRAVYELETEIGN